jgi:hypothetical protein
MIITIVRDVQDGCAILCNVAQGNDATVGRLIKWPVVAHAL